LEHGAAPAAARPIFFTATGGSVEVALLVNQQSGNGISTDLPLTKAKNLSVADCNYLGSETY
jgi:hypothetical protein